MFGLISKWDGLEKLEGMGGGGHQAKQQTEYQVRMTNSITTLNPKPQLLKK